MKKTELKKGNYVTCDLGGILKIKSITPESCTGHLRPITLTKKWLIDFGLIEKRVGDDFSKFWKEEKNGNIFVVDVFTLEGRLFFKRSYLSIHYVHQLQNIYFALTQTELTIS